MVSFGPDQAAVGTDDRRPVGVFSGQGSQWAQMGAERWRPNRCLPPLSRKPSHGTLRSIRENHS